MALLGCCGLTQWVSAQTRGRPGLREVQPASKYTGNHDMPPTPLNNAHLGGFLFVRGDVMSPTKNTILDELERGAPMRLAAAAAGLDVTEVRDMLRADVLFAARVRQAVAKGARASLDKVLESDDWRAHAWFLERTHPEDFGQRQTVAVESVSPDEVRKQLAHLIRPAWLSTPEARRGTSETAAEGADNDDSGQL